MERCGISRWCHMLVQVDITGFYDHPRYVVYRMKIYCRSILELHRLYTKITPMLSLRSPTGPGQYSIRKFIPQVPLKHQYMVAEAPKVRKSPADIAAASPHCRPDSVPVSAHRSR